MNYRYQTLETPAGRLYLIGTDDYLEAAVFRKQWPAVRKRFAPLKRSGTPALKAAQRQLAEYFSGRRRSFELPIRQKGTPFQEKVWTALAAIPFGEKKTYKEQAAAIGAPNAVRAVGRTNGLNLLCIVRPCHRVVGSSGALTGYAGGLNAKKILLHFEQNQSSK